MLHHVSEPSTMPGPHASRSPNGASEARWRSVQARDRSADGSFVYGVTSTGVFCRPSCPSRRPRRDRVRFFDLPADALREGFRPCRRCHPTEPAVDRHESAIRRVAAYLDRHADDSISLGTLGALARLSPSHLQRRFKHALGVSPREYQAACRARRFRHELRAGRDVTGAIYEAGYGSPSRVYETPPTGQGVSPAIYRRGGEGLQIGYAIVSSPLGRLLVAATGKGICAVKLGDDEAELAADLAAEFPLATLTRDAIVRRDWIEEVVARLDRAGADRDLPLDVRGTAFQWRVWRALQRIPRGRTESYSDIARAIGCPTATRAVARACASNPVAVVVPCHRVVPKDGSLGGYRWGAARKRQLLDLEKV
jgi:AraC family transcriptional regulator, regulatory protein of adaptative response / methylated-DNA-[protein]-cysteine methyltransferase